MFDRNNHTYRLTPEETASEFLSLYSEDKLKFFNELGRLIFSEGNNIKFKEEMRKVSKSDELTDNAKLVMEVMYPHHL